MSKWKCEICNSEFENFQAQGFNNKIYCPLCYFKKLYKEAIKEINKQNKRIEELCLENERLNNIISKTIKYVESLSSKGRDCDIYEDIKQNILQELKENK